MPTQSQRNVDLEDPDDDERFEDEEDLNDENTNIGGVRGLLGRTTYLLNLNNSCSGVDITKRCRSAIDYMAKECNLDIATLLYFISWHPEVPEAISDPVIQYARSSLMHCEQLPDIIRTWYKPPRKHSRGTRTRAAREALELVAEDVVSEKINREMRKLAPIMRSPPEEFSGESLLSIKLDEMAKTTKEAAPTFWKLLHSASCTPLQIQRNTYKDPTAPILMMIATASFGRSHHRSKLQKLNSIYFKSNGTAARALDTLYSWGISMSHKWAYDGLEQLSESQRVRLREDIVKFPWSGSHDNLNLGFKIYEQRLSNQNHFDSGTAATIYCIKDPEAVPPDRQAYAAQRAIGCENPINALDILDLDDKAGPRIREQAIYQIKKFLMDSPAFDFGSYEHRDSAALKRPPPVNQLPTGSDHATCQYMLDVAHIEEVSFEGNKKCFDDWFKQLHLDGDQAKQELALKKLIVWIGDQLTTCRIRGLKKLHSWDLNTIERFQHILEIFGWF